MITKNKSSDYGAIKNSIPYTVEANNDLYVKNLTENTTINIAKKE